MSDNRCPNCGWTKLENKARGKAVAYARITLCPECKEKRKKMAEATKARMKEEKKSVIIAEKMRTMAIDELKKDGVLDNDGNLV